MSTLSSFIVGIAVLPAMLLVSSAFAWLLVAARRAWQATHQRLLFDRVKLRPDPAPVSDAPWRRNGKTRHPRTYEREANRIRDALIRVPRLYLIGGFGWQIAIIRDFRDDQTPTDDSARDGTEETE